MNNKIIGVIALVAVVGSSGFLLARFIDRPASTSAVAAGTADDDHQLMAAVADDDEMAAVKASLKRIIPDSEPDAVRPAPLPGTYEVVYGAQVMYVSSDGRYIMQGDLIDLDKRRNLTEETRTVQRKKLIAGLDEDSLIIFKPKGEVKHTVTVFTDIDCAYCRKLHRHINDYLDRGIEIRYASFPRTGRLSKSYFKAVTVWCSDDRQEALTRAKSGVDLPRKECDNPIDEHMDVADDIGVSGTPTIVMQSGDVIPGYVPAARLAQMLEQNQS